MKATLAMAGIVFGVTVSSFAQGGMFPCTNNFDLPGNYITHDVNPRQTDARIRGKNNPQFALVTTNGVLRNQLVVFLPGTGGVPASFENFCQNAANLGFHALALTYDNDTSLEDFCGSDPDANCYYNVRTEFLTGLDTSSKTNVGRTNSIEFRLAAFLSWLEINYPAEGWGQFLVASNSLWTNALAWNKFLLAGHSQGSGYAAFIAKLYEVQRVATFAGGDFWDVEQQAADWNFLPSATPPERWFGFTHYKDPGAFFFGQQLPKWEAQNFTRFGSVVDVNSHAPPYDYSHTLTTLLEPCPSINGDIGYHGAPINDPPQVRDINGVPLHATTWTYMLTGPTTAPVPTNLVADSVAEFSSVQGLAGWRYGYWNRTSDPNGIYNVADFIALPTYSSTLYAIPAWIRSNDLQVAVWLTGARPHGVNTNACCTNAPAGPELWPVRRWLSSVSGQVTITGTLAKWDSIGGDGVTGLIKVNGVTVWSAFVDGTNVFGTNYTVIANLPAGSLVDFMVSPGASSDHDGARFTAQILAGLPVPDCGRPTLYVSALTNSMVELRWEACTNRFYQLETSTNLQNWRLQGPPLASPIGGGWMTNVVATSFSHQLFRLVGQPLTNSVVPNAPGIYTLYMTNNGITRYYRLNIPSGYNAATPAPLALILHGHNQTANEFAAQHPPLATFANSQGVILVFPDSTANERGTSWIIMDPTPEYPVDDVDFLLSLIEQLDATLNIDRKRVYAGGFSNGGHMSHFLAGRTTNVFAAIAAVGAAIGSSRGTDEIIYAPPPTGPIPAIIVNATNDCKRPFWGGLNNDEQLQPAAFEAVAHYTNANACASLSALSTNRFVTNNAQIHRFEPCPVNGLGPAALITNLVIREHYQLSCVPGTEVLFVTLTDGGHIWPNAGDDVGFDANREVLEFFLRHCRCDAPGATNTLVVPTTPGIYDLALCDQNYNRIFKLMVPTGYTAAVAAPLVFALHGGEQTIAEFSAEHPALFAKCSAEGVILVLPQALDHPVTRETLWANKPFDYIVDDRFFITNLLDHLAAALNVDLRRVYACGFSGGGSFSHYLGSTTTGLLAAIAPVCTQTGWNDPITGAILAPPPPIEPMPVMMVRGTNDTKRPYYGGLNIDGVLCRSAADDVAYWTAGNGCNAAFSTTVNANVTVYEFSTCIGTTEVILVRVDGMPHLWPDAADGYTLDANVAVINFLLRHSRP